jgi:thioredoxin reductase (NADPH)
MSNNGNDRHVKVLVLGSGPAGLGGGVVCRARRTGSRRADGYAVGRSSRAHTLIENYPGFPEGVGGAQLGELFQKQAERFGAKVEFDMAHEVDFSQRPYKVTADSGEYFADTVIITTGASPSPQMSRRSGTDRARRFLLRHL